MTALCLQLDDNRFGDHVMQRLLLLREGGHDEADADEEGGDVFGEMPARGASK